jgi:hypothetical protein
MRVGGFNNDVLAMGEAGVATSQRSLELSWEKEFTLPMLVIRS